MLTVEGLGKRYASRWLFRNLAFTLEAGDSLVVLGANGAGKSTLLRTIVGLVAPSEGRVKAPEGDARGIFGLSSIELNLYPSLTVSEHLRFAAAARGCDSREDELLDLVQLRAASELLSSQISTGMKARLKLALALQGRPPILVLDEPGAGLDEVGIELVARIAAAQREVGCLILATNDPRERRLASLELELAS